MSGQVIKKTVQYDAIANFNNAIAEAKKFHATLTGLKLPKDLKLSFASLFNELNNEAKRFQRQMSASFKTKGDLGELTKTGNNIRAIFKQIQTNASAIEGLDLSNVFNIDTTRLVEAEKKIIDIQDRIKSSFDLKINIGNKNSKNDLVGITELIENLQNVSKSKNVKLFAEAVDSGDLSKVKEVYGQLVDYWRDLEAKNKSNAGSFGDVLKDISTWLNEIENGSNGVKALTIELAAAQQEGEAAAKELQDAANVNFEKLKDGIDGCATAIKESIGETVQAKKELLDFNKQMDQVKSKITNFFSLTNAVYMLRRGLQQVINTVKDLDAIMTETAVVTDFTVGDMWNKLPQYTAAAQKLGVATRDLYAATTLYYQQGLDTNAAMAAGVETMKMAKIAGMDASKATDAMTSAIRGFGLAVNEVNAQRINDVYSKLAAITASDTSGIATAMSKTASIAHSVGAELENIAVFLAQGIETTRESPDTIGTAMKTVLARFNEMKKSPSEIGEVDGEVVDANKVETALKSVGIALRDTNGQFRAADQVLLEVAQKWNTMSNLQQRYIATTAAGSRQQSRFIAFMQDYDRTLELQQAAYGASGAAQQQYEKTLDALDSKIAKLTNTWNEFILGIINPEIIKGAVDLLQNLLSVVNKLTNLPSILGPVAKSLGAIFMYKGGKALMNKALDYGTVISSAKNLAQQEKIPYADALAKTKSEFNANRQRKPGFFDQVRQQYNETKNLSKSQNSDDPFDFTNQKTTPEKKEDLTSFLLGLKKQKLNLDQATELAKNKEIQKLYNDFNNNKKQQLLSDGKNLKDFNSKLTDFRKKRKSNGDDILQDTRAARTEYESAHKTFMDITPKDRQLKANKPAQSNDSKTHNEYIKKQKQLTDFLSKNYSISEEDAQIATQILIFKQQQLSIEEAIAEAREEQTREAYNQIYNDKKSKKTSGEEKSQKFAQEINKSNKKQKEKTQPENNNKTDNSNQPKDNTQTQPTSENQPENTTEENKSTQIEKKGIKERIKENADKVYNKVYDENGGDKIRNKVKENEGNITEGVSNFANKAADYTDKINSVASKIKKFKDEGKTLKDVFKGGIKSVGKYAQSFGKTLAPNLTTAASSLMGVSKAVLAVAAANPAATAAVVALTAAVIIGIKAWKNWKNKQPEAQLKRASQGLEDATQAADNAKESFSNLTSNLDGFYAIRKELKSLVVGTDEWNYKLLENNKQVLDLINQYKELGSALEIDENGVYSLNDDTVQNFIREKAKIVELANIGQLLSQADVYRLQGDVADKNKEKEKKGSIEYQKAETESREAATRYDTTKKAASDAILKNMNNSDGAISEAASEIAMTLMQQEGSNDDYIKQAAKKLTDGVKKNSGVAKKLDEKGIGSSGNQKQDLVTYASFLSGLSESDILAKYSSKGTVKSVDNKSLSQYIARLEQGLDIIEKADEIEGMLAGIDNGSDVAALLSGESADNFFDSNGRYSITERNNAIKQLKETGKTDAELVELFGAEKHWNMSTEYELIAYFDDKAKEIKKQSDDTKNKIITRYNATGKNDLNSFSNSSLSALSNALDTVAINQGFGAANSLAALMTTTLPSYLDNQTSKDAFHNNLSKFDFSSINDIEEFKKQLNSIGVNISELSNEELSQLEAALKAFANTTSRTIIDINKAKSQISAGKQSESILKEAIENGTDTFDAEQYSTLIAAGASTENFFYDGETYHYLGSTVDLLTQIRNDTSAMRSKMLAQMEQDVLEGGKIADWINNRKEYRDKNGKAINKESLITGILNSENGEYKYYIKNRLGINQDYTLTAKEILNSMGITEAEGETWTPEYAKMLLQTYYDKYGINGQQYKDNSDIFNQTYEEQLGVIYSKDYDTQQIARDYDSALSTKDTLEGKQKSRQLTAEETLELKKAEIQVRKSEQALSLLAKTYGITEKELKGLSTQQKAALIDEKKLEQAFINTKKAVEDLFEEYDNAETQGEKNSSLEKIRNVANEQLGLNVSLDFLDDEEKLKKFRKALSGTKDEFLKWFSELDKESQKAMLNIPNSIEALTDHFKDAGVDIETQAENIENLWNQLDGLTFEADGTANFTQIFQALLDMGYSVEEAQKELENLAGSSVSFSLIYDYAELFSDNPEKWDAKGGNTPGSMQSRMKYVKKIEGKYVPGGTKNTTAPSGGSGGGGGGGGGGSDATSETDPLANKITEHDTKKIEVDRGEEALSDVLDEENSTLTEIIKKQKEQENLLRQSLDQAKELFELREDQIEIFMKDNKYEAFREYFDIVFDNDTKTYQLKYKRVNETDPLSQNKIDTLTGKNLEEIQKQEEEVRNLVDSYNDFSAESREIEKNIKELTKAGVSGLDKAFNILNKIDNIANDLSNTEILLSIHQEGIGDDLAEEIKLFSQTIEKTIEQLAPQKELKKQRQDEFDELINKLNTDTEMQKYITINADGEYEFDRIKAENDKLNEDSLKKGESFAQSLQEANKNLQDANKQVLDTKLKLAQFKKTILENTISVQENFKEMILEGYQKVIDELNKENENIKVAQSDIFEAVSKELEKQRQDRQNEKTEENIADKEARLAYLQADTTGANALEIKNLEKELEEEKLSYADTLIDQHLKDLQDRSNEAAEQRERQIALQESLLEDYQINGGLIQEIINEIANNPDAYKEYVNNRTDLTDEQKNSLIDDYTNKYAGSVYAVSVDILKSVDKILGISQEQLAQFEGLKTALSGIDSEAFANAKEADTDLSRRQILQNAIVSNEKFLPGKSEEFRNNRAKALIDQISTIDGELGISDTEIDILQKIVAGDNSILLDDTISDDMLNKIYTLATKEIKGDIDGDGRIAAADARKVLRHVAGFEELNKKEQAMADVTNDGRITAADARLILRVAAGLDPITTLPAFKTGGLADFTGPAWLDGTKSKPEMVLNATETKNFLQLKDILSSVMRNINTIPSTEKSGDMYLDFHIQVDKMANDYDVDDMASRIKQIISQEAMYRNVNLI